MTLIGQLIRLLRRRRRQPISWTDFIYLRFADREPGYRSLDKLDVLQLMTAIGVPIARTHRLFNTAAEIDLSGLPDSFVLKPTRLSSRRGVMLLRRLPDGSFHDQMQNRTLTESQIVAEQSEHSRRDLKFIAEERLIHDDGSDRIPPDYKVFVFNGKVELVTQIDRNPRWPAIAFFTDGFSVPDVSVMQRKVARVRKGKREMPVHATEILDIARKVSLALKTPFVSVDCYSTTRGAVLGEITFTPGTPYYGTMYRYTRAWERRLGAAFAQGYFELGRKPASIERKYGITYGQKPVRLIGADGMNRRSDDVGGTAAPATEP